MVFNIEVELFFLIWIFVVNFIIGMLFFIYFRKNIFCLYRVELVDLLLRVEINFVVFIVEVRDFFFIWVIVFVNFFVDLEFL